jgi:hypothetical protein
MVGELLWKVRSTGRSVSHSVMQAQVGGDRLVQVHHVEIAGIQPGFGLAAGPNPKLIRATDSLNSTAPPCPRW